MLKLEHYQDILGILELDSEHENPKTRQSDTTGALRHLCGADIRRTFVCKPL